MVLAASGCTLTRPSGELTADLASTGGPSSLSTLLTPLYLCGAGFTVPKLGVPGRPAGGIDVLAQIPGYRTSLSAQQVHEILDRCGFAHFLAGEVFAPMDATFFKYRQQSEGQDIPALVSASILSKKIACGVQSVGIDIRVAPHGNFGKTFKQARENSKPLLRAATKAGLRMVCLLTDGRFPYQPFIGRGEALAALDVIFSQQASGPLESHNSDCQRMAQHIAQLQGIVPSTLNGRDIEGVFYQNLVAQGASVDAFQEKVHTVRAGHLYELRARASGFFSIDLSRLRDIFQHVHPSLVNSSPMFPDEFGVILRAVPGTHKQTGDLLATVRASEATWKQTLPMVRESMRCVSARQETPVASEVVYG